MIFNLPERFRRPFVISSANPIFVALVAIGILSFAISLIPFTQQKTFKTPTIQLEEINFPSLFLKNNFIENAKAAQTEVYEVKRYELLKENFTMLRDFYVSSHDPKIREQAEIFAQFMAQEFPGNYQKDESIFKLQCLDLACGTVNYPEEIEALKSELKSVTILEAAFLENIFKKFEAAAISTDENFQWSNYFDVFSLLKSQYESTKDSRIKDLAEALKSFMKKDNPDYFNFFEERVPELLTIS